MPRYSVDDKVYNIPEDKEKAFLAKFPKAKLKSKAPLKMHDGTDDPETHPEGNVEGTTTDPVVVSENTGSDGEDGSSDQQEITTNVEVDEVVVKPKVMTLEAFIEIASSPKTGRIEKGVSDGLNDYYSNFEQDDLGLTFEKTNMLGLDGLFNSNKIKISSDYLLNRGQEIRIPKKPYVHQVDENGNVITAANGNEIKGASNRADWVKAYNRYVKMTELHFLGLETAPTNAEERIKLREVNDDYSKDIALHNINFGLKDAIEVAETDEERQDLENQLLFNEENPDKAKENINLDSLKQKTTYEINKQQLDDWNNTVGADLEKQLKDQAAQMNKNSEVKFNEDEYVNSELDKKRAEDNPRQSLVMETYEKAINQLQNNSGFNMVQTLIKGGLSTTRSSFAQEYNKKEFNALDWVGEDKSELLRDLSYKDIQALANGDWNEDKQRLFLAQQKQEQFKINIQDLNEQSDELEVARKSVEENQKDYDDLASAWEEKSSILSEEYAPISSQLESVQKLLEGDIEALDDFKQRIQDQKDPYIKDQLIKLHDSRLEDYDKRYEEYKELRSQAEPFLERSNALEQERQELESSRTSLNTELEEVNSLHTKINSSEEKLYAEFSYDKMTKVIGSDFKLDDEYYEWKNKRVTNDTGVFGSARDVGNTIGTGLIKTGVDLYLGTAVAVTDWLGGKASKVGLGSFSTSENIYDNYDKLSNKYGNLVASLTTFVPVADGVGRKDGVAFGGYKHAVKTTANMLPFTLQIIMSARKGDVSKMGKLYGYLNNKGVNKNTLTALKGSETAWRLTIQDNVQEGKSLGLDDKKAQQYGFYAALSTSLSQLIMPDIKLIGGGSKINSLLKQTFAGNLKSAVTKKAALNAVGQFWVNYVKEYGEEATELVFQNINKHSLGLGHGSIFGTLEEHRDIAESVFLLNGTLAGASTSMGSGDYQAFRSQLFDGFKMRGVEIVQDIESDMLQVQEKIDLANKIGNVEKVTYFTDMYNKMKKGRDFSLMVNNAVNLSPETVTNEQLDLVIQKQQLINIKKDMDSSFHAMYDSQIETIENKIQESGVSQMMEQNFDRTTKNAKTIGEKMGVTVKIFGDKNNDPAKEIEQYLRENTNVSEADIKGAMKNQGGAFTLKDGTQAMLINKNKSLGTSGNNVAAHELLHKMLAMTMAETTAEGAIITDGDGNPIVNKEAAIALQEGLGKEIMKMNPNTIANSTFSRRIQAYQTDPSSVQAQELLTLFSDALATGDIKFEENVFTKVGDFVRRAMQSMGIPITFSNGRDVFNFLRDFNASVAKGGFSKAQEDMFKFGAEFKGDISKLKSDPKVKREADIERAIEAGAPGAVLSSKDMEDLKEFDDFTQNADGTPKYSTQDEFKMSEDYYNGYSSIVDSGSLDGLIKMGMTDFGLKGEGLKIFVKKVKEEIGLRYLGKINKKTGKKGRGFDIEATNGSLFGWITGVAGGGGKSIIFRARGDVMVQYTKDKGGDTVSLDKNIGDGATFGDMLMDEGNTMMDTFEQENLSHTDARDQAIIPGVFASAFGLDMAAISNAVVGSNITSTGLAYVDAKKAVSDVQKVKNNKGKLVAPTKSSDVVPTGSLFEVMQIVSDKFGVPATRVLANQTLSGTLRANAQETIKENWKDLRDLALPEGETVSGQSTLVANTGLGVFYNKGERISMSESGSGVGKESQTKRDDITKEQFWAEFGINPDGSSMGGTKFDGNIREIIKQAAAITANQGVRINDLKSGTAETAAVALFGDGRSSIAFSKDFRLLPAAKQTLFVSEIPQISVLLNPSVRSVADWTEVRDVLVSVFEGSIPKASLGGIAKDIVKMAKYFKPVADSGLDVDGFDWGNYVADNFNAEADNITKLLDIEIDGVKIGGSELYDNIDFVAKARKVPGDIGKALLNTVNPKTGVNYTLTEVARVMAILKPMYAGATQIGRQKFKVDKNGKLYEITPDQITKDGKPRTEFSRSRYQVFDSASDFMKWGVIEAIPGMTQEIYDAASTTLLPQSSKYAVEKGSYEASLAEATEVREVINIALNVVGNNDVDLAMFMISANSQMTAPIRRAASLRYIADSVRNMDSKKLGSLAEYEHMIPANYMAIKIIQEHKKGGIKDINEFYKDYTVAVIPKTMDNVLKAQGLQSLMNAGYQFGVDPSWVRYYNSLTIPFAELETIRDISTGDLIGEPYTRIEIDKKIENAKKYTKARNNILASKDIEPQGMSAFDFDDTLATTKSGIRYTMPNPSGKPQPRRKAILIAGNAGAGKTTIINKLGLRKQGFKYVNQDIALDWLTKNNGLPKDMNEFTREQSDKWRELGGQAAVAAKNKASRLQGQGDGVVIDGTGAVGVQFQSMARDFSDAGYDVQVVFIESSLETAIERNSNRSERRLTDATVRNAYDATQKNKKAFREMVTFFPFSAKGFIEVNTDNMKQGDPLPADLVGKMDAFTKGYIKGRINAEEFALNGAELLEQGAEYDFSEFNKVVEGAPGPLLQKAINRAKKFGNKDIFVLTARPAESAKAIRSFLLSQGLNIPIENITGLGNSTGKAKADWLVDKYAKGYNDIYFVDDAMTNVSAVREAFNSLDIKGSVVQAKMNFSKDLDLSFNQMLENTKGIGANKIFSRVEARRRGKNKGRFTFFVPPSAEDFAGLLRYFAGTGKQGDADIKFFEEALIKPFARADRAMSQMKQAIRDDYKALQKEFPTVKKKLGKLTDGGKYTYDMAVRVYLFDKAGHEIPGISKSARIDLTNIVKQDSELRAYADALGLISRQSSGYLEPTEHWDVENIAFDLQNATSRIGRKEFLSEWIENKDIIFSAENLNKIEAIYGTNFRSALEDSLSAMETGQNRKSKSTKFENSWNNWINNSVGAIMFFNARSAVLQTLSTVNFINFEDNNIFAAGKAFANQKQYWSDFSMLFNSDFLKNRRAGLATNVNEAELASAVAGATNKAKAALQYLLKIGFTPTQIADSFAIASGGSTYYRNRVNKYVKEGMSKADAESQAMLDFREIAEETQQSARPDRISQQQRSNLGRIVLAFANTPMQYNRLIKKAAGDLINKRGDWRANVSRIVYYGAIQNFIFASLQNALFALAFDDDEELTETQQAARDRTEDTKHSRILNSMFDSLARGSGIYGAALATLKNAVFEFAEQDARGWRADYAEVVIEGLNVSPPLGSKVRKLYSAGKTRKKYKDVMSEMSMLDYDNPGWQAIANVVEATTNIPMARAIRKIDNIREALNKDNTNMKRMMLFLGWSAWDLNVGTEVVKNEGKKNEYVVTLDTKRMNQLKVEQEIDARKTEERKKEAKKKKEEKKLQEAAENEQQIKDNIEKQKKEGKDATCAAISGGGNRCKSKPVKDGFCTVHEKVEQNNTGEKKQCKHVKPDGKRCKMKTNSKSGNCYYHD